MKLNLSFLTEFRNCLQPLILYKQGTTSKVDERNFDNIFNVGSSTVEVFEMRNFRHCVVIPLLISFYNSLVRLESPFPQ